MTGQKAVDTSLNTGDSTSKSKEFFLICEEGKTVTTEAEEFCLEI